MGCAKLGAFWQGRSGTEGRRALDVALDAGIDLLDTADCYARGISERLVGRAVADHPNPVLVCTKVGLLKTPVALMDARRAGGAGGAAQLTGLSKGGAAAACYAPGYVTAAAERSLRRLRAERVDLLLLHAPPAGVIRRSGYLVALEEMQRAGKLDRWGFSCGGVEEARAALEVPGVACLQIPYNPRRRDVLDAVGTRAGELGVAIVAAGPFGDGTLLEDGWTAEKCLRFALRAPGVSSVLAGMSEARHVRANVAAAAVQFSAR